VQTISPKNAETAQFGTEAGMALVGCNQTKRHRAVSARPVPKVSQSFSALAQFNTHFPELETDVLPLHHPAIK